MDYSDCETDDIFWVSALFIDRNSEGQVTLKKKVTLKWSQLLTFCGG